MRFPLPRRHRSRFPMPLWALLAVSIAASLSAGIETARADRDPAVSIAQAEKEPVAEQGTASGAAAEPQAPATGEPKSVPPESEAVPPGVELIRVRGRAAAAIEADVPSSLTAFDASTLQALGAQNISDLSRVTPNVNIVQPGSTQATFFVRGVGLSDFSSNAAGAVTIFQDDVAIDPPAIQTGQLYDVESVDVLRGPQGSGPFRNASAGAITVRSRRPTGNYAAQLRATLGHYDAKGDTGAKDALIQDYEGALEIPIVADALSSRFAFRFREADPYKTNGCANALPFDQRKPTTDLWGGLTNPGVSQCGERGSDTIPNGQISTIPFGLPKYVDDEHNWAARGTLRFQPPDTEWQFFLNAHGSRLDQDSTLGQAIGTTPLAGGTLILRCRIRRHLRWQRRSYVDPDVQEEFNALCGHAAPMGTR